MNKAKAELKNLRIAPRKVRRVSDVLRGALVNEAFAQLQMMTWRAAPPVYKLLKSAVANAKNKNMDLNKLFIESIMVNQGPMLKRHLPRAMGRVTPIQKKMSHVYVTLSERDKGAAKFTIYEAPKKKREHGHKESPKVKFKENAATAQEARPGFLKKFFRRKAI